MNNYRKPRKRKHDHDHNDERFFDALATRGGKPMLPIIVIVAIGFGILTTLVWPLSMSTVEWIGVILFLLVLFWLANDI